MRKSLIAVIALFLSAGAFGQAGPVGGSGRYVIVHSPHIQSNTMLLDTLTGKTWQLTKFVDREGEPVAWEPVAHTDNSIEMLELRKNYPPKSNH
jgi:hypothetical protein